MSTFKKSLALVAILGIVSLSADCNWRTLNHDHKNTRTNPCEEVINTDNVAYLATLWGNSGNSVQSSPTYENGIVYYGDIGGNLYAADATTGAILQQVNLGAPIESSPLVTSTTVYVATIDLVLHALDKSNFNTAFWTSVIDSVAQSTGYATVHDSPVIVDNLVIIGVSCDDYAEASVLGVNVRGSLNAFYADTGVQAWTLVPSTPAEGYGVGFWSTPAIDKKRKLLFVGTSNTVSFPAAKLSDSLLAIHYKTGKIKWARQFVKNDVFGFVNPTGQDKDVGASPNLFSAHRSMHASASHASKDLVGVCGKDGVYRTFERSSGKSVWKTVISKTGSRVGNPSAAVNCDTIFAICNEDLSGSLTGPTVVQANIDNCNELAQEMFYDALISGTKTVIKALDPSTGKVKWKDETTCSTIASLTEANGVVYHTNAQGDIRSLDAKSGVQLGILYGTPFVTFNAAPLTVADGKVFVGQGVYNLFPVNGIVTLSVPVP